MLWLYSGYSVYNDIVILLNCSFYSKIMISIVISTRNVPLCVLKVVIIKYGNYKHRINEDMIKVVLLTTLNNK